MTTLIIHNGDAKTGTSYIQNFLDVNRSILFSEHQTLYPNFNAEDLSKGRCHNHALWYNRVKQNPQQFADDLNKLSKFVQSNDVKNVIISNEAWFLQKADIEVLLNLSKGPEPFQLKTISYLRRVDFWFESAWKQWGIKQFDSCDEFSELPLIQERFKGILNHLEDWAQALGYENVIVRPYEKQQLTHGLVHDFITALGMDHDATQWNPTEATNLAANTGFNRDVLEMLHYCRNLFTDIHDNRLFDLFSDLLTENFQKKPFEDYALVSPQQRLNMINNNLPYEKQIAEKFMGRENGTVFHDPLPNPNEPWQPYEGLTLEKALPILVTMIDSNNQKQLENRRLLSQIRR